MWEGISNVAGSAVSGIGGHFQKIGQQKQFLDFLTSDAGKTMSPEMMSQYQGLEDGGIVDYFKESSGVQSKFDVETKRRKTEYDQSVLDYEKGLETEESEFEASRKKAEQENIDLSKQYDEISQVIKNQTSLPPGETNRIHLPEQLSKRKMRKLKKKQSTLRDKVDEGKMALASFGDFESKLTAPGEFSGLSPEDSTKILKKHLLEGMNAGVFTKKGLVSGYTKHRAKKEMSSFMGKVNSGTMTDADFWGDAYAMNNPQAAVRIYDSMKKKQAATATADFKFKQDQAFGQGTLDMNTATNILDDPSTDVNETKEGLLAALNNLNNLGLSPPHLNKLSNQLQTRINSQDSNSSSNKELAEKWGNTKLDVLADMTDLDPKFSSDLMEILNEGGEGLSGENYQEFEDLMIAEIQTLAKSDAEYLKEFNKKMAAGLSFEEMMESMETTIKGTEARRRINQLKSVLKKINNPEFRIEDGAEVDTRPVLKY